MRRKAGRGGGTGRPAGEGTKDSPARETGSSAIGTGGAARHEIGIRRCHFVIAAREAGQASDGSTGLAGPDLGGSPGAHRAAVFGHGRLDGSRDEGQNGFRG